MELKTKIRNWSWTGTGTLILASALAVGVGACQEPVSEVFTPEDPATEARIETLVASHIAKKQAAFADIGDVQITRTRVDRHGKAHAFLAQTVNGVPVFGGAGILHFNADGSFESMTDDFVRKIRLDTTPAISEAEAIETAVGFQGGWRHVTGTPQADLQVLVHDNQATLTYRVQIAMFEGDREPAKPVVFVDAETAELVWQYDNLAHQVLNDPGRQTFDMAGGTDYAAAVLATDADAVALDAHTNAGHALDYLAANHDGRASFDGLGSDVLSYVHYGRKYVNAFWDGEKLTFGDGDGRTSLPLVTLDIVAHELAHGVMDYEANLIYANEPGALNEANSDILAAATEAFVHGYPNAAPGTAAYNDIWLVGEDCWLKDPNRRDGRPAALRYMDDPSVAGDPDFYADRYTGTEDNGGVHTNSGIANLWFHLLSQGGTHPRGKDPTVVAGIGVEAAADVWFDAVADRMTPWADFADAREATVAAAQAINPSYVASVEAAWAAVGVTHSPLPYDVTEVHSLATIPEGSTQHNGPITITNVSAVRFTLVGPTGDGDMYVRSGSSSATPVCTSFNWGTLEMCEILGHIDTDYWVSIEAWADASNHPGDVTDATLEVLTIACETTPEASCGDRLDNDCDGNADCDDADCSSDPACASGGGGGSCIAIGDACDPGDTCCGASSCREKGRFAGLCW